MTDKYQQSSGNEPMRAARWSGASSRLRRATLRRCTGRWSAVAMCVLASFASASEPDDQSPSGSEDAIIKEMARFVLVLNRHQRSLLDASGRTKLEEIEVRLRALETTGAESGPPAGENDTAAPREKMSQALEDLLTSLNGAVRVDIVDGLAKSSATAPVTLPGDAGAVLLRIRAGDSETRYVTANQDMSSGEDSIRFAVTPTGAAWVLVELSNVPAGRSSLLLKLDGIRERWIPLLIDVTAPQPGRLKVTVEEEAHGRPVPAMVRLVWKTDGSVRRPGNAIDLAPHFDNQGNPADPRMAMLPGGLAGAFWCVPGPFDMMVPPGDWELTVRRGIEHAPIIEGFHVESGGMTNKTLTPRRWIDMGKRGWMAGDAHVHFRMQSDTDARRLLTWAQAEDVQIVNVLAMGDINRTWFPQRGFGPEHRFHDGDVVLVPGQECPRTHEQLGHLLALNTRDFIRKPERYYLYDELFDAVREQGGLVGYAHVGSGDFNVHRDMSVNVPAGRADFAEIMQFGELDTRLYYAFLNLGFKLTAAAGSDVPWGGTLGEVRMYAHAGAQPFSPDAWFDAVKRGRTFVTNGPMIEFRVNDARPGDEIEVSAGQTVRVQARAWCDPRHMRGGVLRIVRHGDVVRSIESDNAAAPLALDFSLPGGDGFWIAAHATCGDGSQAHTTPIYVVRPPLRFWKHAAAGELIRERFDSLHEIEELVATAQRLHREGRIDYHRPWKLFALQGPEVLQRVAAARERYEQLQAVAAREANERAPR